MIKDRNLPSSSFSLPSTNELWQRVASDDVATVSALMDLGLSPLSRVAGRMKKGSAESTSLWLLACEAPSSNALNLMWERLSSQERAKALASKTGKNVTILRVALEANAFDVMETLVTFNDSMPASQRQPWDGWAILNDHLNQQTYRRQQDHRDRGVQPQQQALDAGKVHTLHRAGLLPAESPLSTSKDSKLLRAIVESIRAGALGCLDALLSLDRPIPWGPLMLGNVIPWGWVMLSAPHPAQTLSLLMDHGHLPDMECMLTENPLTWESFRRDFVVEPFRTPALLGKAPRDLLREDPACHVMLETRALRAAMTDDGDALAPRPRSRL